MRQNEVMPIWLVQITLGYAGKRKENNDDY